MTLHVDSFAWTGRGLRHQLLVEIVETTLRSRSRRVWDNYGVMLSEDDFKAGALEICDDFPAFIPTKQFIDILRQRVAEYELRAALSKP